MLCTVETQACLREYASDTETNTPSSFLPVFYRSFDEDYSRQLVRDFDAFQAFNHALHKELSDVAVHLARLNRFEEALYLLKCLHQQFPEEAIIAANLGSVFELTGELDSAFFYTQKSINHSKGSFNDQEWAHLSILLAKMQMRLDPDWILANQVFSLQLKLYKPAYATEDSVEHIRRILRVICPPIQELILFGSDQKLLIARVLLETGELLEKLEAFDEAVAAYFIAQHFDSEDQLNTTQRMENFHNKMYALNRDISDQMIYALFPARSAYKKRHLAHEIKYSPIPRESVEKQQKLIRELNRQIRYNYMRIATLLFGLLMLILHFWKRT